MSNYSIADKSTPTQLHTERGKVLKAVDNDRGRLEFMVSLDRDGNGADIVLWEKRGTRTWGIPVCDFTNQEDAHAVAKTLNGLVQDGILRPGPLVSTNDPVADAPLFKVSRGGALGGAGVKLAGGGPGSVWAVEVHHLKDKEAAQGLSKSLNHLLAGKVLRAKQKFVIPFASEDTKGLRLCQARGNLTETMASLADGDPVVMNILLELTEASKMVDPKNKDAVHALLHALDQAGIYGRDIEGLYQVCGRHPGKTVAVLRATTLGLIDEPALKAALKPMGFLQGDLGTDEITKAVEATVPEFSAARAARVTLTGAPPPGFTDNFKRLVAEGERFIDRATGRKGK